MNKGAVNTDASDPAGHNVTSEIDPTQGSSNALSPSTDYGWQSSQATNSVDYCFQAIRQHLNRLGCKTVLDIGCGNGAMTNLLHKAGFQITAIEPDRAGFTLGSKSYPEIEFHNVGVYDDTSELGTFDAVISSEVIEHLYDPSAMLSLATRHLSASGALILTCPFYGFTKNLMLSLTNRWDDHHQPARVGGHIKLWSHRTMNDFLVANDFVVETLGGAGRFWPIWASLVAVARLKTESYEQVIAPAKAHGKDSATTKEPK